MINVSTHLSRLFKSGVADAPTDNEVDLAIQMRLKLLIDGKPFAPDAASVINDFKNDMVTWQAIVPKNAPKVEVLQRLFPEDSSSRTLVSFLQDGQLLQEILLDAANPDYRVSQPKVSQLEIAGRFLRQGTQHILSGPDHVLFVLGLLLLGGSLWSLLKTVTAFTVAHSITLSLAATGVFSPSSRVVEPLIAISIVAIAFENLRSRPETDGARDYRPIVAFSFGLVHGFGFASALSDIGLTGTELGGALVSFNIGVEVGQGAIILVAFPLISWLAKQWPLFWNRCVIGGSMTIGAMGAFWFVSRLFG